MEKRSIRDGAGNIDYNKERFNKVNEFLKESIPKKESISTPEKSNVSDSSSNENNIKETRDKLLSTYPPEEEISKDKTESTKQEDKKIVSETKKKGILNSIKNFFSGNKNKLALGASLFALGTSQAQNTQSAENIFSNTALNNAKKMESVEQVTKEKTIIKIANYFETDKADISIENKNQISKLISEYIASLNKENVDMFIESTPQLNVSSDPRHTNTFPGGNPQLSRERAIAAQETIKDDASKYDFSKSDLDSNQIKEVIEKFSHLKFNIPESGVVDYHTVATEQEWSEAQTDPTKMLEIFQKMRFVNLELVSLKKEKQNISKENSGNIFEISGYKKALLLVDKSPSMENHKKMLIDSLVKNNTDNNIDVKVFGFTNKIDTALEANNLTEAAKIIENIKFTNEDEELVIDNTINALKMEKGTDENAIAFIITDEQLQHVSQEKLDTLEKLSKEKGVTLKFTIMVGDKIYKLSLDDIQTAFNQKFKEDNQKEQIAFNLKQLEVFKDVLKQQIESGASQKEINETRAGITSFANSLNSANEINISDFDNITQKQNIVHIGPDYTKNSNTATIPGARYTVDRKN
ncbi:MAG: VWA domain-containing protein [Patescibacteria group bacterium]|nr:VWA domain-containing protein [Patescibacteria group bacterium]